MNYENYIPLILTGVGTAAVGTSTVIWKWVVPKLNAIFDDWMARQRALTQVIESVPVLHVSLGSAHATLAVLQKMLMEEQHANMHRKRNILIIEDSPTDADLAKKHCEEVARDFRLATICTPTMAIAHEHIPRSRVIVVDLGLPDASPEDVKRVIAACSVPVIVHSDLKELIEEFRHLPDVVVIEKGEDNWTRLRNALRSFIAKTEVI